VSTIHSLTFSRPKWWVVEDLPEKKKIKIN
jgi:hypothetical protein